MTDALIKVFAEAGIQWMGWVLAFVSIPVLAWRIVQQARDNVRANNRNTELVVEVMKERHDRDRELADLNARITQISTVLYERLPMRGQQ